MNLQKLDKRRSIRTIDLKNECLAYLWKKNHSHIKYIEFLANNLNQSGKNFIILWENLDFFFAVKDKYDDITDAKDFINGFLHDMNTGEDYHYTYYFWNYPDMDDIIISAITSDETAINKLVNRYSMYKSAYELLFEVIAKSLTGYTFETAYYETTNSVLPENISDTSEAHSVFAEYFKCDNEAEYEFKPYRLDSTSEYLLGYDVSVLTDIISEITDVNVAFYDVTPTSRDGKIFEQPAREYSRTAMLYEFADEPYVQFGDIRIRVTPEDLQKEIIVCSVYIGNFDNKLDTFHKETEVTVEDVAKCIKNLLNTEVYIHTSQSETMNEYIEISWVEAV